MFKTKGSLEAGGESEETEWIKSPVLTCPKELKCACREDFYLSNLAYQYVRRHVTAVHTGRRDNT